MNSYVSLRLGCNIINRTHLYSINCRISQFMLFADDWLNCSVGIVVHFVGYDTAAVIAS